MYSFIKLIPSGGAGFTATLPVLVLVTSHGASGAGAGVTSSKEAGGASQTAGNKLISDLVENLASVTSEASENVGVVGLECGAVGAGVDLNQWRDDVLVGGDGQVEHEGVHLAADVAYVSQCLSMLVNVSHLAADVVYPGLGDAGIYHHGVDQLQGVPPDVANHRLLEVHINLDSASTAALTQALHVSQC